MSATRQRTFPLQRIGVEVWPVHTVQFSNHTGYGAWTGRVFDAALITEVVQGIAARGALGALRRRAVGLHGLGRDRRRDPRCGGAGEGREPARALLLRSGDRRRRARRVRAAGHPGVHARQCGAGRRRRDAEPVRARPAVRAGRARRGATRSRRSMPCTRSGRAPCWSPRCTPTRRRPTRSISWPPMRPAASACARRNCRSRSTARATPSRRCSSRTICAAAPPRRRCRAPHPRCSAC